MLAGTHTHTHSSCAYDMCLQDRGFGFQVLFYTQCASGICLYVYLFIYLISQYHKYCTSENHKGQSWLIKAASQAHYPQWNSICPHICVPVCVHSLLYWREGEPYEHLCLFGFTCWGCAKLHLSWALAGLLGFGCWGRGWYLSHAWCGVKENSRRLPTTLLFSPHSSKIDLDAYF